jgi:hypothetical protein
VRKTAHLIAATEDELINALISFTSSRLKATAVTAGQRRDLVVERENAPF